MGRMAFWNNGSPRIVRIGSKDKITGRFIGSNADVNIDLYKYEEQGPRPNKYEVAGAISYSLVGDTVVATRSVADVNLDRAKHQRKQEVKNKRDNVQISGIEWSPDGGNTTYIVQTDKESQAKLAGAVVRGDKEGYAQQGWRMQDNSFVILDKAKFDDLAVAVGDHVDACYVRQAELDALVDAATTVAEVLAVDIETDWPAHYTEAVV